MRIAMAMTAALVARIAAAKGDFPARIGTTAVELAAVAERSFAGRAYFLQVCRELASTETHRCLGGLAGLDDDDARVIAFFLAEKAVLSELKCGEGMRVCQTVGDGGGEPAG